MYCVGIAHLDINWYIATTSHIGRFFYVPVRQRKKVSNRSVLLTYQLRRRNDVSALLRTLKFVTKMSQFFWVLRQYILQESPVFQPHSGTRVPRYNISMTSISFSSDLSATCSVGHS